MFTECEQWRKDFNVDEIVKTFKFDENPLVTVYYPRYYHKTDKVVSLRNGVDDRMDDLFILSNWGKLTLRPCTKSPPRKGSYRTLSMSMRSLPIPVWYLPLRHRVNSSLRARERRVN